MPDEKEFKKALRVIEAAENAKKEGKGVISIDGKMVDAPVVARARHLLELADLYGFERSGS
jgi:citrate lyase subunit beta/citryl-CoA lyase